jgi:DNA-binding NarL/FixJ family response regulator
MEAGAKRGFKKTVLVVDDSARIRSQLRDLFLSDGFDVCAEAENGREALAVASDCKPHIIILDLAMPIMGGIEVAPQLRKLFRETPIILFSLHADYLKTLDLPSLGISAVMSKTAPLEELLHKANELVAAYLI